MVLDQREDKKYNEITDLASPLSFFKNNFINLGKKDVVYIEAGIDISYII